MLYAWLVAIYTPREFIPYRTTLTQVVPGYTFKPGLPSVEVPFDEFVRQAKGKPFILSYPLSLDINNKTRNVGTVFYLLDTRNPAGELYVYATQPIPDYWSDGGSFGYSEHTGFDSNRIAFVSVLDGTSYWAIVPILISLIAGLILGVVGLILLLDSNALKFAILQRLGNRRL